MLERLGYRLASGLTDDEALHNAEKPHSDLSHRRTSGKIQRQFSPSDGFNSSSSDQPVVDGVPNVPVFYGREADSQTLQSLVLDENCCLVAVLGIGGIGKTTLVAKVVNDLAIAQHSRHGG